MKKQLTLSVLLSLMAQVKSLAEQYRDYQEHLEFQFQEEQLQN